MVKRSTTDVADAPRVLVVENWTEELKQRVLSFDTVTGRLVFDTVAARTLG
jgi:hypothetical protein